MSSDPPHRDQSNSHRIGSDKQDRQQLPPQRPSLSTFSQQIRERFSKLTNRPGVHTPAYMSAAGFSYTGTGDTARCEHCGLEVSGWTLDMKPYSIHLQRKPDCPFIRSMITSSSLSTTVVRNTSTSNEQENPSKRLKIETNNLESQTNNLIKADLLQEMRIRTFSHWPHCTNLSNTKMIEAGFFSCNVGDRVVCMDCNLIFQRWTPYVDQPSEIHKTLSPDCKYVREKLRNRELLPIINPNESNPLLPFSEFIRPPAQDNRNNGIWKPVTVSSTTPNDKRLSIDDLILGGYFNTDNKAVETCSYCNKSLQHLGSNNDPMIKHALWLLHCAHAKQLNDDDELYHKTRESTQSNKLERTVDSGVMSTDNSTTSSPELSSRDYRIISRLIAAKFNVPILQRLRDGNLIDQLQIKEEDSISDRDLLIACAIIQEQIDRIDGKQENITTPGEKMAQIREQDGKEQAAILAQNQAAHQSGNSISSNLCVLCLTEEKGLACIPCGHLATCVLCRHSLRSCPICRRDIEAFVRIYS